MPLRVAINLASATDRFRGGTGTFVDGLLDGLAGRDDVDVVIIASPAAAARDVWSRHGTGWHQEIVTEPAAASFGFASIGDPSAIAALVRRLRIDVWFTPHSLPAPAVLPCATVGAILDVQHEDLPELYTPRERARRALVYETIARTCSRVVTLSSFSEARIAARYALDPARIDVIPLGPPAWTRAPRAETPPPSAPYVLYPATTWRHKNHITLIEALACVRARDVSLDLRLTGLEGEAHADVMAAIGRHGLDAHVRWLGHVDEASLRGLYDGALAVAVPSRYEGFGLPVVEAMARGVPVVASDAASLPEVAGDATLQVPPLDVGAWADALARLAMEPALRARLREAGARRVADFSFDAAAALASAAFARAAADGPRGAPEPRHVGPDRGFPGRCRYYVQAPSAATLEIRGTAAPTASWTMTCVTTPNGGLAAQVVRQETNAFAASWLVAGGPAGLELTIETSADSAALSQLALRLPDGIVLDILPSLTTGGPEETLDESIARAVVRLQRLATQGLCRVALYGAGSHSRRLLEGLAGGPCRVVAVIDDTPSADRFEDVPLVAPASWSRLSADALVLSSRDAESKLAARAAGWLPPGVLLIRLHTESPA